MPSRRAAVLGSPIAHSMSPALHRAAYAALGLDWAYDAIEVTTGELPGFLDACAWPDWAGVSLTMPLKTDVLPLLDEVSSMAAQVHAANTVVFTESGRVGHNTDVAGMQRAVTEAGGTGLAVASGTIIGGGATARSAMAALAALGADRVEIIARSRERARPVEDLATQLGVEVTFGTWADDTPLAGDVVIATVPPGAADDLAVRVGPSPAVLLDVAYGEGATALARAWAAAGGAVADGLDLLLWQAVDQVRLMTGRDAPVEAMRSALARALGPSA